MAILTAQVVVGASRNYASGLYPTHFLYLFENDHQAWLLVDQNIFPEEQSGFGKVTWVPTPGNILEDALLMIAIHVLKHRDLTDKAKSFYNKIELKRVELQPNIEQDQLNELYRISRKISYFPKLIITCFKGSLLEKHLPALGQYKINSEICRS